MYRRPPELIDDLTLFINDFTETLNYINMLSRRSYISEDFNIDLLKINRNICDKRKRKKDKWMTNNLSSLINQKMLCIEIGNQQTMFPRYNHSYNLVAVMDWGGANSRFLGLVSVWAARSFDQTALRPSVIKRIRQIDVKYITHITSFGVTA